MPIYDISESKESPSPTEGEVKQGSFFSALTARILFFLLLVTDFAWALYSICLLLVAIPLRVVSFGTVGKKICKKRWIALKRSAICGVALFVALFSPSVGIMIACTYFMMYDKLGIQEVVPRSLQDQFQEFAKS